MMEHAIAILVVILILLWCYMPARPKACCDSCAHGGPCEGEKNEPCCGSCATGGGCEGDKKESMKGGACCDSCAHGGECEGDKKETMKGDACCDSCAHGGECEGNKKEDYCGACAKGWPCASDAQMKEGACGKYTVGEYMCPNPTLPPSVELVGGTSPQPYSWGLVQASSSCGCNPLGTCAALSGPDGPNMAPEPDGLESMCNGAPPYGWGATPIATNESFDTSMRKEGFDAQCGCGLSCLPHNKGQCPMTNAFTGGEIACKNNHIYYVQYPRMIRGRQAWRIKDSMDWPLPYPEAVQRIKPGYLLCWNGTPMAKVVAVEWHKNVPGASYVVLDRLLKLDLSRQLVAIIPPSK